MNDQAQSTHSLVLGIWSKLSRRRRIQIGLLFVVMLFSGGAELASLGAVLPFLAVLSAPDQLWREPLIRMLAAQAGLTEPEDLLLPATVAFAAASILAAAVRLTNSWLNGRLSAAVGSDLSGEAYRRSLYQAYAVHVQRNSSTVINTISTQVGRSVAALNSIFLLATSVVVTISLFSGLMLIDWKAALAAAGLFGGAYGLIGTFARRKLSRNSGLISAASSQVVKAVQEGLGSIRDVILDGSQQFYQGIYLQADRRQRQLQAKNDFLVSFPRFALEALGMVAIACLGWLLVRDQSSNGSVIPLLGALALGAQRLLPALQQAYSGWGSIKGFNADLSGVLKMLEQPMPTTTTTSLPMSFNQAIQMQGVRFRYGEDLPEILHGLDLEIHCGERIGLVGVTGSGKSTTVDLLMGLLEPTEGRILIDGQDLYDPQHPERLTAWRAAIAHVPQNIYLADSTIAENIAFGIPKIKINLDRVMAAAEQAQIARFIESSNGGYSSSVGERGIRLSGGQRQRIGIARALYKRAKILVLDEATSALDSETEEAVMDAVNGLSKELTVVIIAHRLSTLQNCDRVIEITDGHLKSSKAL